MEKLGDTWLWISAIVIAWTLAILFYFGSGSFNPDHVERRVDTILRDLGPLNSPLTTEDTKRHLILDAFIREQDATLRESIFLHLAIAFAVAGMLILGVEGVARYRTKRELQEQVDATRADLKDQAESVSRNVWNAIFRRLVPPPIAVVVENVLRSQICRIRPRYVITFRYMPYTDIPEGFVVVRRELHYKLWNVTGALLTYPVSVQVVGHTGDWTLTDPSGQRVSLPAITSLRVGGHEVPIKDRQKVSHSVPLERMESETQAVEVISVAEELLKVTDRALYVLTMPSLGLELSINNEVPNLIEIQHDKINVTSGMGKLKRTTESNWTCEDGLLPGTALEISWKQKVAQPTPAAPARS